MNRTKQYPDEPGFYYWRENDADEWHVVEVWGDDPLLVTMIGFDTSYRFKELSGRWGGKVPEPKVDIET